MNVSLSLFKKNLYKVDEKKNRNASFLIHIKVMHDNVNIFCDIFFFRRCLNRIIEAG